MFHKQGLWIVMALFWTAAACGTAAAQDANAIPPGSKVFIAPISGGFEADLKKAFDTKKVPLVIVEKREEADFEITGTAESKKASTAKKLFGGEWRSDESASISVTNLKTGVVVYAYSVHKHNAEFGRTSTAEACAKHLRAKVEGKEGKPGKEEK